MQGRVNGNAVLGISLSLFVVTFFTAGPDVEDLSVRTVGIIAVWAVACSLVALAVVWAYTASRNTK
ncbi:hypothetical protein [Streptomyces bauhiniae]|uniref:hypothetical protein n=1 Tax=Streptomyces bauhiniae TaxID=2340725 RepID=UPI003662921D